MNRLPNGDTPVKWRQAASTARPAFRSFTGVAQAGSRPGERTTMSRRNNRVRLSDQEKRVLEVTAATVYDGEVPFGVVVERACRNLLSEEQNDEERRAYDRGKGVEI